MYTVVIFQSFKMFVILFYDLLVSFYKKNTSSLEKVQEIQGDAPHLLITFLLMSDTKWGRTKCYIFLSLVTLLCLEFRDHGKEYEKAFHSMTIYPKLCDH